MKSKELKRIEAQERQEAYDALPLSEKIAKAGEKELVKRGWVRE
jgi:hypothetical protein